MSETFFFYLLNIISFSGEYPKLVYGQSRKRKNTLFYDVANPFRTDDAGFMLGIIVAVDDKRQIQNYQT